MDWKKNVEKELKEVRELADYISDDPQATQRLKEIREKVDKALEAIEKLNDGQ